MSVIMDGIEYFTTREVAQKCGVAYITICYWKEQHKITPSKSFSRNWLYSQADIDARVLSRPGLKPETLAANRAADEEMAALYKSGKTLMEIGAQFNLSRERIRQRLERIGVSAKEGGKTIKSISRTVLAEKAYLERLEARSQNKWGCSVAELEDLRASLVPATAVSLEKKYHYYRDRAIRQKSPWKLTYPQFVALAKDEISKFGQGKLVLRVLDQGNGYEFGNIAIMTHSESSTLARREGQVWKLYQQGKGPTEIGRRFGIKPGTVSVLLARAKNKQKFAAAK